MNRMNTSHRCHLFVAVEKMATFVILLLFVLDSAVAQSVDLTVQPYAKGQDVVQTTVDRINSECVFEKDLLFLRRMAYVASRDGMDTRTYRVGYYGGIWQIDEAYFRATTSCTGQLQSYCGAIKKGFNIDWASVTWQDLTKPLYSALAVRMFMEANNAGGSIPGSIDDQAMLWATRFNGNNDYLKFITDVITISTDNCDTKIDLAFVVDSSGSIGPPNFRKIKDFLKKAIERLNVGEYNTRVAMVTFSATANVNLYLNSHYDKSNINQVIDNVNYVGAGTGTHIALNLASKDIFKGTAGSRDDAVKLILLITDGQSNDPGLTLTAAKATKDAGIIIFSLGIGILNVDELNAVSTPPQCTHVSTINNFDELDSILDEVHKSACRASRWVSPGDNGHYDIGPNEPTVISAVLPPGTNNTGIVTTVECGKVDVYISYTTPHPGPSLHDMLQVATPTQPSYIYVQESINGRPVYITYIGSRLPGDISQCSKSSFSVTYIDGKPEGNKVKCIDRSGTDVVCTPLDFLVSRPYGYLFCKDQIIDNDKTGDGTNASDLDYVCLPSATGCAGPHPHPNPHKFIQCDPTCSRAISMDCPADLVWNDPIKTCDYKRSIVTGHEVKCFDKNGSEVMCTRLDFMFSPYTVYSLLCKDQTTKNDNTGGGTNASGLDYVCLPTGLGCVGPHPHPGNPHKFIQCDPTCSHAISMDCPADLVWNDNAKWCDYKSWTLPRGRNMEVPASNLISTDTDQSTDKDSIYNGSSGFELDFLCMPNAVSCAGPRPHPGNPHMFIQCDPTCSYPIAMDCPPNHVWNDPIKTCDQPQATNQNV